MTTYNRASLKTYFQTGDVPTGTDYANLIDSCLNIVETGVQTIAGPINPTEVITPRVSAATITCTSLEATAFEVLANSTIGLSGTSVQISSTIGNVAIISNSIGSVTIDSSASFYVDVANTIDINSDGNIDITSQSGILTAFGTSVQIESDNGTFITGPINSDTAVSAPSVYVTTGVFGKVGIVSAAGTTQGTAASIAANVITRAKGVTDGSATGFAIPANKTGLTQVIYNDNASANLWPPTGGQINALATNAAFPMAANTPYIIYHITASAYAVK